MVVAVQLVWGFEAEMDNDSNTVVLLVDNEGNAAVELVELGIFGVWQFLKIPLQRTTILKWVGGMMVVNS